MRRRRWVGAWLVAAVVAAPAVLLDAAPAGACSCAMADDAQAVARADAVFAGVAVDRARAAPRPAGDGSFGSAPVAWAFDVRRVFKGPVGEHQELWSEADSAACGTGFELGATYLVFASADGGRLNTGLCSGNRNLSAGEPLPGVLGAGREPLASAADASGPASLAERWAPGLAVGAVALLALGVLVVGLGVVGVERR